MGRPAFKASDMELTFSTFRWWRGMETAVSGGDAAWVTTADDAPCSPPLTLLEAGMYLLLLFLLLSFELLEVKAGWG